MKNLVRVKLLSSSREVLAGAFDSLKKLVSPVYDSDEGHGWKHINEVFDRCIKIHLFINEAEKIDEEYYKIYMLASLLHDVYSSTNRKEHHVLARDLIARLITIKYNRGEGMDTSVLEKHLMASIPKQDGSNWNENSFKFLNFVNVAELGVAMECVLNHRSSTEPNFEIEMVEIFAAADNDPLDIVQVIGRIDSCSQDDKNYIVPLLPEEDKRLLAYDNCTIRTYLHLRDKFGRDGYMFKNMSKDGVFMTYYKDSIEKFWEDVDKVMKDPGLILEYVRENKSGKK